MLTKTEKIWIVIGLIFGASVIYHLFSDEELNPEIVKLHDEYLARQERIRKSDNNIYLQIAALGYEQPNAYEKAKSDYILGLTSRDHLPLFYPKIKSIEELNLKGFDIACRMDKASCIDSLIKNPSKTKNLVKKLQPILQRYYSIALDADSTSLSLSKSEVNIIHYLQFRRIAGLEIFYLIQENKLSQAANKLVFLMALNLKLSEPISSSFFKADLMSSYSSIYQPLIEILLAKGFNHWNAILANIRPLPIQYGAFEDHALYSFIESIDTLDFEQLIEPEDSFYWLKKIRIRFMYKKNSTINERFRIENLGVVGNVDKSKLIQAMDRVEKNYQEIENEINKMQKSPLHFYLRYYKNQVGGEMLTLVPPVTLSFYHDFMLMEIKNRLLALKIKSHLTDQPKRSYTDLIKDPEFFNPYSLKSPILKDEQACYQIPKEVCIDLAVLKL